MFYSHQARKNLQNLVLVKTIGEAALAKAIALMVANRTEAGQQQGQTTTIGSVLGSQEMLANLLTTREPIIEGVEMIREVIQEAIPQGMHLPAQVAVMTQSVRQIVQDKMK